MTEETIKKLEDGFIQGLSDREASLYANITPQTLYNYCKEYPDFLERKELLKESVKLRAKQNVAGGINKGDKPLSQWYLERRDKEFSDKKQVDVTTQGEKISIVPEILALAEEELKKRKLDEE